MMKNAKEPKSKILRVIARLNIGGPAIHTILLTRYLDRLGYHTLLATGEVGPEEGDMGYLAEAEEIHPVMVNRLRRSLNPLYDLAALVRILKLMFKFRPDIVHTHTAKAGAVGRMAALIYNKAQGTRHKALGFIPGVIPSKRAKEIKEKVKNTKCKVIHTFHGHVLEGYFSTFKSKLFQWVEKALAKCTDVIVVVSEQQKKELYEKFGIGRPEQYRVVPLGLNLNPLEKVSETKGKLKSDLGLSENEESLVGIVGRLTPIKNHCLFLESVSALMNENSDIRARFLIAGDGESRRDLEEMTKELALADRVQFTGWIKDLESFYADLDVLALTSNNEGTPVAVIEAMAACVPVVATDVGGVRELISDFGLRPPASPESASGGRWRAGIAEMNEGEFEICERGVLVERGDVEGFAKGLHYLLKHPEVRKEMGLGGRQYAMEKHTAERLVSDMDKLYQSLLMRNDK